MRFVFIFFIILSACKNSQKPAPKESEISTENQNLTKHDIEELTYRDFVLSSEVVKLTQKWPEYIQLQEQVDYLKKGDLDYFSDNRKAIKSLFTNLEKNIPSELKTTSILARIKVIKTQMYKIESLLNLSTSTKSERLRGIKDFFVAMSNFKLQMNKITELKAQNIKALKGK